MRQTSRAYRCRWEGPWKLWNGSAPRVPVVLFCLGLGMITTAAARVVARFCTKKKGAIVFKAKGTTWGWLAQGPQLMHLRPLGGDPLQEGVVWLEDRAGVRDFETQGLDEDLGLEGLKTWTSRNRHFIERLWLDHMLVRGWLAVEARGTAVIVKAYPGGSSKIVREIDLSNCPCWITDDDLAVEKGTLIIGVGREPRDQVHLKLRSIIWSGQDDGSDRGTIPF